MRRLSSSKKRHEANRFIRKRLAQIWAHSSIIVSMDSITTHIFEDGTGSIFVPSRAVFEYINPASTSQGIVFIDGSFLVLKEIFRYEYATPDANVAQIRRLEYSYHYQRPIDRFFFRFDFHPEIGNTATHPLYHLHVGCLREGATQLPNVPRIPVEEFTLDEMLSLIHRDYFG